MFAATTDDVESDVDSDFESGVELLDCDMGAMTTGSSAEETEQLTVAKRLNALISRKAACLNFVWRILLPVFLFAVLFALMFSWLLSFSFSHNP